MKKPKIFVSSTIYDFEDMRSALKYWLGEVGYDTQMSEFNDFQKDVTLNSYDACLNAIAECDYFLLLIGSRSGGEYPGENKSITQKEYETAYDLMKQGKIKKIITLIRKSVWDVKEDRKSLEKLLIDLKKHEEYSNLPIDKIKNHSSKIIKEAEKIIDFINVVTRNEESKNKSKPSMNWVHTFTDFSDIITTLKSELKIYGDTSLMVAETNIKSATIRNMQELMTKENDTLQKYYLGFTDVRAQLKVRRDNLAKNKEPLQNAIIEIDRQNVAKMSDFAFFAYIGIDRLDSFVFEHVLSQGLFLKYCGETDDFIETNFNIAIRQMIIEITQLKISEKSYNYEIQGRIMETIKDCLHNPRSHGSFLVLDIIALNSLYERIHNIVELSAYILSYINTHDDNLAFPELLHGFVKCRPTKEDIINSFIL